MSFVEISKPALFRSREFSWLIGKIPSSNESVWKEEFRDLELGEDEIILAMIENPRLMERPIIVNGDKAVVARPAEKLLEVL